MTTITSYGHERVGAELARQFLSGFGMDQVLTDRVCMLILYHMQILFVAEDMHFADVKGMKANTDVGEVALPGPGWRRLCPIGGQTMLLHVGCSACL